MVMPAGVAAAAGGVGGGVHGRLVGLVVGLQVLLMRGLMHLEMLGVDGLVLLLLYKSIRVVRRRQSLLRARASAGIEKAGDEDADGRQHDENDKEFHGMGD